MLEAGIDSERDYAFDVFRNLASLDVNKQQDFCAVFRFATRIADASITQLQTMVLSHGHFPATLGSSLGTSETRDYAPWTEMIQRWAIDMLDKLYSAASPSTQRFVGLPNRKRSDLR